MRTDSSFLSSNSISDRFTVARVRFYAAAPLLWTRVLAVAAFLSIL